MRRTEHLKSSFIAAGILWVTLSVCVKAQTATTIYTFTSSLNGSAPDASLVQGRDGQLYGTTDEGGANTCTYEGQTYGCGAIFKVDTLGNFTLLHSFDGSDGLAPQGITLGSDGNFYGVAEAGGANGLGSLYKITASGVFTKLHDFANGTDGEYPDDQLLQASDGNLYGLSETGLYRATTSGTVTTLFTFSKLLQYNNIPLIQATNGYLYASLPNEYYNGTTTTCGAFIKFSLQGSKISEHDFSCLGPVGNSPDAAYVEGVDGNFYGTNAGGGTGKGVDGTAVKIDAHTGVATLLLDFVLFSGGGPWNGLILGTDGNFYGCVVSSDLGQAGAMYQLTPAGGFTQVVALPFVDDGYPSIGLVQHTNGEFYGSVPEGEQGNYYGSIYAVDTGLGPFIRLVSQQGRAGSRVQILGQGLTGATSVTFNGVAVSSFTVVSDTFMTAVVPAGATSGPVVVTTPSGALTSNKSFRISSF